MKNKPSQTKKTLQDLNDSDKILLLNQVTENHSVALGYYQPIFRKIQLIDAIDRAKLWEALGSKFPAYQILPDTNHISYIKENLVASIYSVTKGASVLATSEDDREAIANLNVALEYMWDRNKIGHIQLQAGENAALHNVGVTEVGWDVSAKIRSANGSPATGDIVLRNVHPLQFMRDPFARDLETAAYCMTWDDLHKNALLQNPAYKKPYEEWCEKKKLDRQQMPGIPYETTLMYTDRANATAAKDYVRLYRYFYKDVEEDGTPVIREVHTVNNEAILYYNASIKPKKYPFAQCFCNIPNGDVVGQSECMKVLRNSVAYNVINSLLLTSEYRNQRPPKFMSSESGLNLATFTKHGNDPDYTFVVRGPANQAIHYHEFPAPSPSAIPLMNQLSYDMQQTSGIDGRYTGRDTGSVITTGGVEDMLTRVTLIDSTKIKNYEDYTEDLSYLILANFIEYGGEREYVSQNPNTGEYDSYSVNYKEFKDAGFLSYAVNISSELPKNKQRLAAWANNVLEKQAQYAAGGGQQGPDWITPEEWLEYQDAPNKERMLKRMNIQRLGDKHNTVANIVYSYGAMVGSGLSPEEALARTADNEVSFESGQDMPYPVPSPDELGMMQAAATAEDPLAEDPMAALAGGMTEDPGLMGAMGMLAEEEAVDPLLAEEEAQLMGDEAGLSLEDLLQ